MLHQGHTHLGAHWGFEKTIQILLRKFPMETTPSQWPSLRTDTRDYIRGCPTCQKMSPIRQLIRAAPFTLAAFQPFERIAMDTIGPLPESADGSKYIVVLIDSFTRHVQLTACKDVSAESAANALVRHMSLFGCPRQLITDQGTQFVNGLFKAITHHFGFHHFTSIPYSKEENGIVERANKEVNRHIRNIMFDTLLRDQWHSHLAITEHVLNSSVKEPTGVSPNTLLSGTHTGAVDEAFILHTDELSGLPLTVRQYLDNFLRCSTEKLQPHKIHNN
jgi:hypothetical protein